jgi:hypothetical protein
MSSTVPYRVLAIADRVTYSHTRPIRHAKLHRS